MLDDVINPLSVLFVQFAFGSVVKAHYCGPVNVVQPFDQLKAGCKVFDFPHVQKQGVQSTPILHTIGIDQLGNEIAQHLHVELGVDFGSLDAIFNDATYNAYDGLITAYKPIFVQPIVHYLVDKPDVILAIFLIFQPSLRPLPIAY